MKQKSLLTTLLLVLGLGAYTVLNTSYSHSNSLGSYNASCGCHGGMNSATTVTINGLPTFYALNTAYPISVTVSHPTQPSAGFQVQANIGTISSTDANVFVYGDNMSAGHGPKKNMTAGSATFNMTWTSPATGGTAAMFSAVGNAVNLAQGNGGDIWNSVTSSNIALPVNYLNVSAQQIENHIEVNFSTEDENNTQQFEIQYSNDASLFKTIATIKPNASKNYSHVDYPSENNKTHFYRILEISNDATEMYSEVVSAFLSTGGSISFYPTVLENNTINVKGMDLDQNNSIVLYDGVGRKVLKKDLENTQIDLPQLNSGIYFITLLENNHVVKTDKLIVR